MTINSAGPYRTNPSALPLERKDSLPWDTYRMVSALEAMDACRRRRQLERELQHAWRSSVCDEVFFIENSFLDQLLAKIEEVIINVRLPTEYKSADYARAKATSFGIELFKCWLKHASAQRPRAAGPHARVLIANEESESPPLPEEIRINYTSTRWCVDSGANRDICREPSLFNGNVRPKILTIGEAGQGHSFMSQVKAP